MKKYIIYTCLVGGYEELRQPSVIDNRFDYVCFSNDYDEEQIGIWQIRKIPYKTADKVCLSRYVKLNPHKVLGEYEYSLWMDANIQIVGKEFYSIVVENIKSDTLIAQVPHLVSNCIYKEIRGAYYGEKINILSGRRAIKYLRQLNFPEDYGLFENNIILRSHNNPLVISISNDWWTEFLKFSNRDQFSLMYVYWKHNFMPDYLIDGRHNSRNVSYLRYILHPSMKKKTEFKEKHKIYRIVNAIRKKILIKIFLR